MTGASDGPLAILIGPMASGKTSVGRELARLCDVGFRDLDHEIGAQWTEHPGALRRRR